MIFILFTLAAFSTITGASNFWVVEESVNATAPGGSWTSCQNNTETAITTHNFGPDMLNCLDSYDTDDWKGMMCSGVGWFKGTDGGYQNPENCFHACYSCMVDSIIGGSNDTICWNVFTEPPVNPDSRLPNAAKDLRYTRCHMGFHPS